MRTSFGMLTVAALLASGPAVAAELALASGPGDASGLLDEAEGRLLHPGSGGYHVAGGPPSGYLFGLDVGAALPLATGGVESQANLSLGARLGYQFANGLSVAFRYEDLGLAPDLVDSAQFQFAALEVRYSFPYVFPMPFIEAAAGLSIATANAPLRLGGGSVSVGPGGSVGLGVSFPLTHHFAIDVTGRDWLAPLSGQLFQIFTIEAGLAFAFGGPARP